MKGSSVSDLPNISTSPILLSQVIIERLDYRFYLQQATIDFIRENVTPVNEFTFETEKRAPQIADELRHQVKYIDFIGHHDYVPNGMIMLNRRLEPVAIFPSGLIGYNGGQGPRMTQTLLAAFDLEDAIFAHLNSMASRHQQYAYRVQLF